MSAERKKGRRRNTALAEELSRAIQQREHAAQSLRRIEDLIIKEKISAELRAAFEVAYFSFINCCFYLYRLFVAT